MRQLALALSLLAAAGCFLTLDPDGLEMAAAIDAGLDDASVDAGQVQDAGSLDAGQPDAGTSCPPGMALVRGGTFKLAETDLTLTVADFCLDDYEVTTTEYQVWNETSANPPGTGGACNWNVAGREAHPVNCVKWSQAFDYCQSQQKRLPTEAEWEWAARGGEAANIYPWGSTAPSNEDPELCWSGRDERLNTCAIANFSKGKTALGIFDLAGNAAEWTNAGGDKAAVRGGSWSSTSVLEVQTGHRVLESKDFSSAMLGFRCAKSP